MSSDVVPVSAIENLEALLLHEKQLPIIPSHHFAPGLYCREVTFPANSFIIGHEHTTRHFNVMLKGRVSIIAGDMVTELVGPAVFVAEAGVRKVAYVHEETVWLNFHPTTETDPEVIESQVIKKSDAFQSLLPDVAKLRHKLSL